MHARSFTIRVPPDYTRQAGMRPSGNTACKQPPGDKIRTQPSILSLSLTALIVTQDNDADGSMSEYISIVISHSCLPANHCIHFADRHCRSSQAQHVRSLLFRFTSVDSFVLILFKPAASRERAMIASCVPLHAPVAHRHGHCCSRRHPACLKSTPLSRSRPTALRAESEEASPQQSLPTEQSGNSFKPVKDIQEIMKVLPHR
jgi:hypothetical protein